MGALLAAGYLPQELGSQLAFPFLLATTVLGYMGGMSLPKQLHRVVHPVIVCGAAPNVGAALWGTVTGDGYWATLQGYLTKVCPCTAYVGDLRSSVIVEIFSSQCLG